MPQPGARQEDATGETMWLEMTHIDRLTNRPATDSDPRACVMTTTGPSP